MVIKLLKVIKEQNIQVDQNYQLDQNDDADQIILIYLIKIIWLGKTPKWLFGNFSQAPLTPSPP